MCTVILKSGHVLEQYLKIKFRVKQSVRRLEHVPCLFLLNALEVNKPSHFYFTDNISNSLLFKGNAQFILLSNPPKSLANVYRTKILKGTVTKKENLCFYN